MSRIYLASSSKARAALLRQFGLKFTVMPSRVKEQERKGRRSFAGLAKHNARAKAEEVAGRLSSGVVIAADTIVVQGRRISGKPSDMADARRMLKRLSRKPQWLYTGVAVINKDTGVSLVECEKTKVIMDPLSDAQITRYFSSVSPLDKAGSFDIQGRGAFFIRRVEGCFYNVVGLPMRTLGRMLAKSGAKIFCLLACAAGLGSVVFLSGCTTEYNVVTKQEDTVFYSNEKEEHLGFVIDKEVLKEYKLADDPLVQKRVEDLGKKIVAVCDRKDIEYHFKVLEDDEINAVSLPGGYIYVNKGLIDKVASDDELAAVLAHEVGHVVARHSIKKLQGMYGYSALRLLTIAIPASTGSAGVGAGAVGATADTAFLQLLLGYSREDELLADTLAARYLKRAGYDPHAMISFLKKLQDINRRKPPRQQDYFRTHPYVSDRVRVVKQELGEALGFTDIINMDQESPHAQ